MDRYSFNTVPFACILKTRSGFTKKILFSCEEFNRFALDGYQVAFYQDTVKFRLKFNHHENGFFVFEEW